MISMLKEKDLESRLYESDIGIGVMRKPESRSKMLNLGKYLAYPFLIGSFLFGGPNPLNTEVSSYRGQEVRSAKLSDQESLAQTTFTDVTSVAGLDKNRGGRPAYASVCFLDYDNDGYLDLYVVKERDDDGNVLYRNNKDGTFTDVTSLAGIRHGEATGASFADYDNDGDVDIYVVTANILYRNNGDGTFTDVTSAAGLEGGGPAAAFGDYDNDGHLDLFVGSILYRNNGDGTFTEVSSSVGVEEVYPLESPVFGDYDNDGDLDVFSASFGRNVLRRNDGNETFTDVSSFAGVDDINQAWDSFFGDYDNDGDLDIYVVNWNVGIDPIFDGGSMQDILFRNNGDGTFTNVSSSAGVDTIGLGEDGLAGSFGDYDNDGDLDIFVINQTSYRPFFLYSNNGDGTFTDVASSVGLSSSGTVVTGGALGDYDNDGDLDIMTVLLNGDNILYRNEGDSNNWLHIKTEGTKSNRDGVGARVRIVSGKFSQIREVEGGSGRNQDSMLLEYGLGVRSIVDSVIVRWPSGIMDVMVDVYPNRIITVTEGSMSTGIEDELEKGNTRTLERFSLYQNYPNPFNQGTNIKFNIPEQGYVDLSIYDTGGQLIKRLLSEEKQAGSYKVYWDGLNSKGREVASGIYLYRIQTRDFTQARKMLLLK